MKYLVQTNLETAGKKDFREIYTAEVKKAQLAYAHGIDGSSPEAEKQYVYDKFRAAVDELPDEVTVLPRYNIDAYLAKGYNKIFVDGARGDDANDGTESAPIATIAAALALAKAGEKTAICIRAGQYCIPDTINIGKELSGTPDAPFIFTSFGDGEVIISTAKTLDFSDFSPIESDDEIAARLPESVKDKVLFIDCKKAGWSREQIGEISVYDRKEDIGVVKKFRSPMLYVGGVLQDLARYPNSSDNRYDLLYFTHVEDTGSVIDRDGSCLYLWWAARVRYYVEYKAFVEGKGEKPNWQREYLRMGKAFPLYKTEEEAFADYEKLAAREREGFAPFIDRFGNYNMDMGFTIRMSPNDQPQADMKSMQADMDKISEWKSVSDRDVMIYGNAFSGWDYNRYKVKSIEKREDGYCYLTTKGGSSWGAMNSGNSPTGHNIYYFYNVIEALDAPGEWYMDSVTGRLYVYPTEEMKTQKIEYAANSCDIMTIDADNIIVNGIHFDKSCKRSVVINNVEGAVVQGCKITNSNNAAVVLNDTRRCAAIYNECSHNKYFSITIYDKKSTEEGVPGLNIIQNNIVSHPVDCQLGINISGYLNCVSHNKLVLCNLLIGGGGRYSFENIIEYNDIPGGHTSTSDAGLIYTNQFYSRGAHIRYNYMHDWKAPGNGVYFDDLCSANYAYYNIIDTTDAPGKKPRAFIYSSSGHDHVMYNNFCVGRTQIFEDGHDADGKYRERIYTGTIASRLEQRTPDGKYPFVVTIDGKTYTVMTEMKDNETSFICSGDTLTEEGDRLEVWSIKTRSDDEGDYVSVTWYYKDGSRRRCINYNDMINQSWMYFADFCHLGYRFRGFAERFHSDYTKFVKAGTAYEKRFPELFAYLDMYREYLENCDKEGYRINPVEIFIRSTSMNNVRNNVIVGVPRAFNRSQADGGVKGVDAYGNEKLYVSVDTDAYTGNFDNTSESYDAVKDMVEEYQDKSKPCSFDFRTFMEAVEAEQKKQNPEYKSLSFLLDRVGRVDV